MERCGNCKFWGDSWDKEQFRSCKAIEHDQRDRVTVHDYDEPDDDDATEKAAFRDTHQAVVQDGSGYRAALLSRDDFGCVLFKPKE